MAHEASPSNSLELQLRQALAAALLDSEAVTVRWNEPGNVETVEVEIAEVSQSKIAYPWNPADAEAESFFNALDQKFSLDALPESELNDRADAFFSHLDTLFAAPTLEASLAQKFATVPQAILNMIARQAEKLANSSASLADQLVLCVQEALPQWAEDDLHVLARPLAYSMRGEEQSVKSTDWAKLSETEQARLTLAIAQYALKEIQD
ncbi:hypothetical protein Q2T42_12335 [Leptolyngbya boryana CZ1]|uniref:Uncharacterized protein n=2 Tax=Leptolyngbya boryana TaxID=1184 RepID=A0A1Z4J9A2_LEPBY|nr:MULTISPECIES: hypothetical protein [Leptolyngbya]MBN8563037.1 hypothetical protein [Leptolyngbya sp. UWPOB_LEPTO1]ULP30315.1 hypothetical protein MCP04_00735 [Leptolyngbya boryana IU 594]WNZ48615.1 hypothetical protein Q2T42_12335 [Leptolyngbya boryana CZ1]BAY53345.1 hypothetical protein NIES2135_01490 [Leptolyngbya boryana NIES-2135]